MLLSRIVHSQRDFRGDLIQWFCFLFFFWTKESFPRLKSYKAQYIKQENKIEKPGAVLMGVWRRGCPAGEGGGEGACSGPGLHVAQINFILKLLTFVAPVKNLHLRATSKQQLAELM